MKNPIPTPMAYLRFNGIALTISSRARVSVSTTNSKPEMNTAASAPCHEMPIPTTTLYAKNAFNPIPGARANG